MKNSAANSTRWFFLAALLLPLLASAQWIERGGGAMDDSPYRKSDGAFGAWLLLVPDDRALYEAWRVPGESVHVSEIDSVKVSSPVSAFVVFSGCAADASGNCAVHMRFRVLAPDGSVYADTPSMEVWNQRPAPPGKSLQLSVDYLKMIVEPHEQVGKYIIQVQVEDANAHKTLKLERVLHATSQGKT